MQDMPKAEMGLSGGMMSQIDQDPKFDRKTSPYIREP